MKKKGTNINNNITSTIRKSRQPQLKEVELQLINCHGCKIISNANTMITCSRMTCRESFCFSCLNKGKNFDLSSFAVLKQKERTWKCLKCKRKCVCSLCNTVSAEGNEQENKASLLKRKKKRKVSKRKRSVNIHNQKIHNENIQGDFTLFDEDNLINGDKVNNIIKMDQFEIFECEYDGERDSIISNNIEDVTDFNNNLPKDDTLANNITQTIPFRVNILPKPKIYHINKERKPKKQVIKVRSSKSQRRPFRPCLICRNLKPAIRAIKFKTLADLILSLKELIGMLNLNYSRSDLSDYELQEKEFFSINRNNYDLFVQDFNNGQLNISNQLGVPKRFCETCLVSMLKQENGLKKIFEVIKDNDESITLDYKSKHDILRNMENLINQCYDGIWPNKPLRNELEQTEEERRANIFNKIFNISGWGKKFKGVSNINLNVNFNPNIILNFNESNTVDCLRDFILPNISDEFDSLLDLIKNQERYFENIHRDNELLITSLIQNALIYYRMHTDLIEQMTNGIGDIVKFVSATDINEDLQKSLSELLQFQKVQNRFNETFNIFINMVQSLAKFYQHLRQIPESITKSLNN